MSVTPITATLPAQRPGASFLLVPSPQGTVFVPPRGACRHARPGDTVTLIGVERGPKGLRASRALCARCAAETEASRARHQETLARYERLHAEYLDRIEAAAKAAGLPVQVPTLPAPLRVALVHPVDGWSVDANWREVARHTAPTYHAVEYGEPRALEFVREAAAQAKRLPAALAVVQSQVTRGDWADYARLVAARDRIPAADSLRLGWDAADAADEKSGRTAARDAVKTLETRLVNEFSQALSARRAADALWSRLAQVADPTWALSVSAIPANETGAAEWVDHYAANIERLLGPGGAALVTAIEQTRAACKTAGAAEDAAKAALVAAQRAVPKPAEGFIPASGPEIAIWVSFGYDRSGTIQAMVPRWHHGTGEMTSTVLSDDEMGHRGVFDESGWTTGGEFTGEHPALTAAREWVAVVNTIMAEHQPGIDALQSRRIELGELLRSLIREAKAVLSGGPLPTWSDIRRIQEQELNESWQSRQDERENEIGATADEFASLVECWLTRQELEILEGDGDSSDRAGSTGIYEPVLRGRVDEEARRQ